MSQISILIKHIFLICIFLVAFSNMNAQERKYLSGKGSDETILWKFKISTGRNSGYWTDIPVPSNWELQGFGNYTYFKDKENYKTDPEIGYYKRNFFLNDLNNKNFRLVFQGSMTDTDVKINGKSAGETHRGGFTQFSYDISKLVRKGENIIEVEVKKSSENESVQRAERFADFWLFGGIFRPVYIDILPESHIERIATDAKMDGHLMLDVYLKNIKKGQTVSARLFTLQDSLIGEELSKDLKEDSEKISLEGFFEGVRAWSNEFPILYKLRVQILKENQVIHTLNKRIGFRTFEVRDHDGFYLNGKRILLKGASMHSFRPTKGRSLSYADNLSDIELMKDLNFNTVRTPCYPPDERFLELCDSLGLLVLDELPGWSKAYNTVIGSKITKELVIRDLNHPSVIMWGNGNHRAHNADLEDAFLKWDIQKRRPYKNAAKTEAWPGKNPGRFELINTQYYPTYKELNQRLNSNQVVMPNETLHALYDGGAGAGLADYWKAIEESKTGGGLIIWALYDEGLLRTDQGYTIDNQGNKAPDGIVGPHQERKGSYNAVKEIWSPVIISPPDVSGEYTGKFKIQNKFNFTNLDQCLIKWKYIHFVSPQAAGSGYYTLKKGELKGPEVKAGESGILEVPVDKNLKGLDAVELAVFDNYRRSLWTWRFPLGSHTDYISRFLKHSDTTFIVQDSLNKLQFTSGNKIFMFGDKDPGLINIKKDSCVTPVTIIPKIVKESDSIHQNLIENSEIKYTITKMGKSYSIKYDGVQGFNNLEWTIMPDGILKLSYSYNLPKGNYYYAGVGFKVNADSLVSKRWLGEGPYRIYKNRTQGTSMNVWYVQKKENIPGKRYNFPEFEGYFGNWHWAQLNFKNGRTLGMATQDNLYLGILKPNSGDDPKNALIHYPEDSGIYFFNKISPIGEKWKISQDLGPDGQLTLIETSLEGTIYFNLGESGSDVDSDKIEIE